jgi:ribosomal protein L34
MVQARGAAGNAHGSTRNGAATLVSLCLFTSVALHVWQQRHSLLPKLQPGSPVRGRTHGFRMRRAGFPAIAGRTVSQMVSTAS